MEYEDAIRSLLKTRNQAVFNIFLGDDSKELAETVEIDGGTATHIRGAEEGMFDGVFLDEGGNELLTLEFDAWRRAEVPENRNECVLKGCGNTPYWWETDRGVCQDCVETKFFHNTYNHNFGLVVPEETGHVWIQQTRGVMCAKVFIEGVFIPLGYPKERGDEPGESTDLLNLLRGANYLGSYDWGVDEDDDDEAYDKSVEAHEKKKSRVESLWERIDQQLRFEYEDVDAPDGQPGNQEGLKWIRITEADPSYLGSIPDDKLEGKTVGLYFPNCD